MRKKNAIFPYTEQRNAELFATYKILITETPHIYMPDLLRAVVAQPCSRFWVSEERATIVVSSMMRGEFMTVGLEKADMYREIYRRATAMKTAMPEKTLAYIVGYVVNTSAPRFYMSPGHASRIINSLRFPR